MGVKLRIIGESYIHEVLHFLEVSSKPINMKIYIF